MFIQRSQCWNISDKTKATQFFQDIRSALPNASEEIAHMITSELENIQGTIIELFHDATRSYRQYLNLSALKLKVRYSLYEIYYEGCADLCCAM